MKLRRWAAVCFAVVAVALVAFQLALALGAPWGEYAMGGAFPGQFPPALRVTAAVQAVIIGLMAGVVLARAGVTLLGWARHARWAIWVVVGFMAVSLVLNLITPSAGERMIWAPVVALLLGCSLLVALGKPVAGHR